MAYQPNEDILHKSYTKADAKKLRDAHIYLEGRAYLVKGQSAGTILHVCISPYDKLNKHIFLAFYKASKCPNKALEHYFAPYYDVVLVIEQPDKEIILIELSEYFPQVK
jgi:hypothetical protein